VTDRVDIPGRYELKYWVPDDAMPNVLTFLGHFMRHDAHMPAGRPYKVTSLYFDTRNCTAYYEKYDGDNSRDKYRIRFYNNDTSRLFFEIKSKRGSFVTKIRRVIRNDNPIDEVVDGLRRGLYDDVVPDFAFYTRRMDFHPSVWTSYRRVAYVGINDPDLRITFDHKLAGDVASAYEEGSFEFEPVTFSEWSPRRVMEIKYHSFFPFWLENLMRELNIAQEPISKYGIVMKRCFFLVKEPAWTH